MNHHYGPEWFAHGFTRFREVQRCFKKISWRFKLFQLNAPGTFWNSLKPLAICLKLLGTLLYSLVLPETVLEPLGMSWNAPLIRLETSGTPIKPLETALEHPCNTFLTFWNSRKLSGIPWMRLKTPENTSETPCKFLQYLWNFLEYPWYPLERPWDTLESPGPPLKSPKNETWNASEIPWNTLEASWTVFYGGLGCFREVQRCLEKVSKRFSWTPLKTSWNSLECASSP